METMLLPIYVALFDALKLVQGSQEFVQTYQGIAAGWKENELRIQINFSLKLP